MRRLLLLLAIPLLLASCGTTKLVATPPEQFQDVVTKNSQDENYIKANEWMVENFNDAESVIQFTDKEAGIIKGKYRMGVVSINNGTSTMPVLINENLYAIITLRVKDQKGRIEIVMVDKSIATYSYGNYGKMNPTTESLKGEMNRLMGSFTSHMQQDNKNATW